MIAKIPVLRKYSASASCGRGNRWRTSGEPSAKGLGVRAL
jgi:hypothetical protein